MKTPSVLFRLSALLLLIGGATSCMTTYDSAGRPVQSVDPGVAVAGAAAAGLIGYAIANDNDNDKHRHHRNSKYYRQRGHYHRY